MTTELTPLKQSDESAGKVQRFARIAGAENRRVVIIPVHYVRVDGVIFKRSFPR